MTDDDLKHYERRVAEYAATSAEPEFDRQKLKNMMTGCQRRRELRDAVLSEEQRQFLESRIKLERPDLWS